MKKILLMFLSVTFLVSFLFMSSCQKQEATPTEETVTETGGHGEEVEAPMKEEGEAAGGYGEQSE